jgi:hypothetical protein
MSNYHGDFVLPAIKNQDKLNALKIALACDCAILFGVIEYIGGNESLRLPRDELQGAYDSKLKRLQSL